LSLREKLKALEELQQIDLEAGALRAEMESIPVRRVEIEAGIAEARRIYDAAKGRLADNERERRQVEQLLAMERDKVKKWEGRLGEIRTPREYAALSREIDIAKKTNDSQSEQLKALAAAGVEVQKDLEAKSEVLSEREMAAEGEVKQLAERQAQFAAGLAALEVRRAGASQRVDPALLARYENIKRRRAGIAVAPVVGHTCKGCNRNIPPQLGIVLQRADSVETCPSCHRIIYSAEALNSPSPAPA